LARFAKALRAAKPDHLPGLNPQAAYPGCGRVIGLEVPPPFACDYAVIRHGVSLGVVADVLEWYCDADDPRAVTMAGWLSRVFGREVKEVTGG